MGQMLRNPQIQQMALGMASQLDGQFGGAAQQTGDAASDRAQPTLDLGGMMGAVSQVRCCLQSGLFSLAQATQSGMHGSSWPGCAQMLLEVYRHTFSIDTRQRPSSPA